MKFEAVIWDWNGTILNDLHISLYAINCLLNERNLDLISREKYLEMFTFPVIEYYEKIGFDFSREPFEIPAHQFIDIYSFAVKGCSLHPEAYPCLAQISNSGLRQFILSAMEQKQLSEMVGENRIGHFFEKVIGLDDHYAVSKIDNGHKLMSDHHLIAERTLLIGDTIHDFEVAAALNCHCILVANGHQSRKRLEKTGAKVVNNLSEIEIL